MAGEAAGRRLLGVFPRIHVINLPYRTDRRREMTAELARIGIPAGSPEVTWFDAIRPADPGGFPTVGTRGCFESHLGVLRRIAEGDEETGLLLEDDADFAGGLEDGLRALEGEPWDLVLGTYTGHDTAPAKTAGGLIVCRPDDPILLAHFLGVRREAARRMVPYLEAIQRRPPGDPKGGPMHVDGAYSWFRKENPDIRTLCPVEPMARQRPSRTDIHELPFADRQPALRPVMAGLRAAKRWVGRHRG